VEVPVLVRLHSVYSHLTGRRDVRFCETRAEGYHAHRQRLYGCNIAIVELSPSCCVSKF